MIPEPVPMAPSDGFPPDASLLQRYAAAGAADAFDVLVHRHGRVVYHVCRMILGNPTDADDAYQATFLVLIRRAGAVRKAEALGSWLCGVATRVSLRAKGRRNRLQSRELGSASSPIAVGSGDPLDGFAAADTTPSIDSDEWIAVIEELGQLPDKYRAPLVMCYLEGQTTEEAATELGWAVGTFKSRLVKARELLRHRVARRGLALSAVAIGVMLSASVARAAVPPSLNGAVALLVETGGRAASPVVAGLAAALRTVRSPIGILWRTCSVVAAASVLVGVAVVTYPSSPPHYSPRGGLNDQVATPLPAGQAKPKGNAEPNDIAARKAPPPRPKPADGTSSAQAPTPGLWLMHTPTTRKM